MKSIVHFSIALLAVFVITHAQAQSNDLSINFYTPINGQTVTTPVWLTSEASESANTSLTVEYFANGQSLGAITNHPTIYTTGGVIISTINGPPAPSPYLFVFSPFNFYWSPLPGTYTLIAKVTDDQGNSVVSPPVNVKAIPTPVVMVEATESVASPSGPAIFTITRIGDTNSNLNVPFFLLGTAQAGIDYTEVPTLITIPAGEFSVDVAINPLAYVAGNSKSVTLKLWNPQIPGGGGPGPTPLFVFLYPPYFVRSPGEATAYIKEIERNRHKPSVKLVQPKHKREHFPLGSDIAIEADTVDRDTYVSKVEFFDGVTKIGESLSQTTTPPGQHVVFDFNWSNATIGLHVVRARATDSQNAVQVSKAVRIRVLPAQ
jgi:hypothetical protein